MIIEEQKKDMIIVGEDTSKKATISSDKMAKLQYLLTKGLYKDPITAVIAEWTNNGVDAVVQAGKNPIENPVIVQIAKNDKGQYIFSVEDKGTGLDKDDFENICMNYLESTKESDNDTIGHFGIGMKSFLSLERSATFTCRKEGKERVYVVYEGAEFVNYDLVIERDTTEENGVKAELVINGWSERSMFIDKAKQKLAYYDTAVLLLDNVAIGNTIYRNELFQFSIQNKNTTMHLCLKDVYYQIDWEALGIPSLPIGIGLKFDLSDGITPTPSRESYITNEKTKQLILKRIEEVADWFLAKYNETIKEFDTFLEAFEHIGITSYNVDVAGKSFNINCLTSYSNLLIKKATVKGISFNKPEYYKERYRYLFYDYVPVGYYNYSSIFKTKRFGVSIHGQILNNKKMPVVVGDNFKGNVKEYLKDKYGISTLFVKNSRKRPLGKSTHYNDDYYRYFLNLTTRPKDTWRPIIKEWQLIEDSMACKFYNQVGVEDTDEYKKWLEERRKEMEERRKMGYTSGNYTAINKQKGDVTIAYSSKGRGITFKKAAYKISELPFNKFLTVVIKQDDDIEKAKVISEMIPNTNVKWALVGNLEYKKLPSKQFIDFKKIKTMEFKPFMRLASAILFDKVLDDFHEITRYKNGIFENCLKSYKEAADKLKEYVNENYKDTGDDEVAEYILKVAEHKQLFDKDLWELYLHVKEGIKKYDWITCLSVPSYWDEEATKKYNRIISQILLFRKKYYNDLPDNARIVFDEVAKEDAVEGEFDEKGEVNEEDFEEELETV